MKLIIFAALAALCSSAKLDRTYLPPVFAKAAGGTPGLLQTPLQSDELPAGGFINNAQGVVVDAAAAGTRASPGTEESGLGGPRPSYGSTASKVGDAAFRESVTGFSQTPNSFARIAPIPEHETVIGPVYGNQVFKSKTLLPQASKDYNSNTLSYQNNVESHKYNYGFQTDNGIAVGENGVAHDGIHAQGGYSYKGNDGQDYKVTYTADKGGYQPQGSHLPTSPPIPDDIVKSIEQNAKEEAAGHYDNGSYDSQKYNAEGDHDDSNKQGLFGFGSSSTEKPQAFSTFKPSYGSSQAGQIFPTTGTHGTFGSSSFGQNSQGAESSKPSTQFGQTSFGSQQTITQSQFAQGIKPQFGDNQSSQDLNILPSTPSTFTQFGSQSGQQSGLNYDFPASRDPASANKPAFLTQGSLFVKPQGVDYQKSQFEISTTPTFGSKVQPSGFGPQSTQGSSATATATISGSQPSLSGLSPQVLGEFQRPSGAQSVGDKKQPQPAGFLSGFEEHNKGQQSQGDGQSYHYNQPAKPFISPSSSSQGASLSAGQQISQTSNQFSSFNTQSTQKEQFSGSNKPSQTFGLASPTPSTGSYQPSYNGVTQAAVSPFASPSPTPVSSFPQKVKPAQQPFLQAAQFGQKPSTQNVESAFGQTSSFASVDSQKSPVSSQNTASVPTQQYTGQLYEYNKPEQGISASIPSSTPSTVSLFGQPAQESFSQGSLSSSQFGQALLGSKPVSKPQFGFALGSPTSSPLGIKPQGFQTTQSNTQKTQSQTQFGSHSYKPFGTQFTSQENKPQFGQTSQGSFTQTQTQQSVKPFGSASQFGISGTKPQIGFQTPQSSNFQQSTQQSIQGNKLTNVYLPPLSITSTLGVQGTKPQLGQGSPSTQESGTQQFTQSTQQTVESEQQQAQGIQIQLGSQASKPVGTTSQIGTQGYKPQFGQASPTQGGTFQQTQQTIGSVSQQGQGSQSSSGSYKPFGSSQFSIQGAKPQFGSIPQKSQGSIISQTQTTTQTVGTQQVTQGSQFGSQSTKPFGTTQYGVSGPQSSQLPQSQQSSLTQIQTTRPSVGLTQQQPSFGSQSQFGSQFNKPFGSQEIKPQFGQVSQTSQGSSLTQTTQQTTGSVISTQQQTQPQSGYLPSKPLTPTSQFGVQETKPQFGQVPSSQGSSFQQSTQTAQQTVGSLDLVGGQPSKPFDTSSQFATQGTKPQGTILTQTTQQSGSAFTQPGQGSQTFGSQPSKPFDTTSHFGIQATKPQGSNFTQTSQQSGSAFTQQSGQGSQLFGSQPSKPFGTTSQFGTQETKPQFGQVPLSQGGSFQQSTQTAQQTVGSLGLVGGQPSKPFDTYSQFGTQSTKPQDNTLIQTTQQSGSALTQQSGQGSQSFGPLPTKPFETTSQFGIQATKPQGSTFTQTSQQSGSTFTQQSGQGSQLFGSQPSKPLDTTSQFGTIGTKPQGSTFTQTSQQSGSSFTQQSGQGSQIFGSQTSKPLGTTSQFGTLGTKPQFGQTPQVSQQSITQTQTAQQTVGSVTGTQPSSQAQFGSQSYKPFGTSQIGVQGFKPQFGQTQTTQQSTFTQSQFNQQSSYNKFSQSKPFSGSSLAPVGSVFGTQPAKTQFGSSSQSTQGSTGSSASQFSSQFGQSSQGSSQFGVQPSKPFSTSHHQEAKPQYGAPSKPVFGQSSTTYAPFTQKQNSQTQFGYQYKQPVNAFGKYQPKPQFGSGFTGFGGSHASSSATSFQQPFKGTQFGSQAYKPFGTQVQPFKSQFGQIPTSSASAFASSSSTPSPLFGSKFTSQPLKPFGTPSTVFPTSQPQFGQPTTPVGQELFGTQSPSLSTVQSSDFGVQKPFGSGVSSVSTPQPLSSISNFGFSKPCCQASKLGLSSTTASPSFGVSSTTPSHLSTPQDLNVQGSTQKTEEFKGPKQQQGFDEKTGYYY